MMDPLPVALILISATSHATWNYIAKNTGGKDSFMLLMNITSQFTILPVFIFVLKDWALPVTILPMLAVSAVAEVVYFLSLSRAYQEGDLSIVYPVARSSPLFVAIIASVFLGETLTLVGLFGVLVVLVGVYVLHMRKLSVEMLLEPLKMLNGPATKYAVFAAIATTAYSLSDKVGVTNVNPFLYAFWLEIVITFLLFPIVVMKIGWGNVVEGWRHSKYRITFSGILMRGGYLLVLIAMSMASVGYLLALRQVSVVIGALLGVLILKEGYGSSRMLGSAAIFLGAYILAVWA